MMKVLDLFSGIGGFSLGLERTGGFETVAFCEIDPFCQKVLKKHWPDVPIFDDVRSLYYDGPIDVITGGYPCQPFSTAGKRKGQDDDRHLWPAMFDLIKKHRPRWVIGENVAGHISMGLDAVLADLEGAAYTARTFVIPACAVDARHRRDRLWIVANADSRGVGAGYGGHRAGKVGESGGTGEALADTEGCGLQGFNTSGCGEESDRTRIYTKSSGISGDVADTNSNHAQGKFGSGTDKKIRAQPGTRQTGSQNAGGPRQWPTEPAVGRVAHGIPRRVDRLKSLGNAVVPQIPEIIGHAILEAGAA